MSKCSLNNSSAPSVFSILKLPLDAIATPSSASLIFTPSSISSADFSVIPSTVYLPFSSAMTVFAPKTTVMSSVPIFLSILFCESDKTGADESIVKPRYAFSTSVISLPFMWSFDEVYAVKLTT